MSDDRLANLRDDIEAIMVLGPIGTWTNPPSTFPLMHETVDFHPDGTGSVCMFSSTDDEPFIDPFAWRMVDKGRMRIAPTEELLFDYGYPRIMAFEMVVQTNEFSEELVLVTAGKKIFDNFSLNSALRRKDPPLRLPPALSSNTVDGFLDTSGRQRCRQNCSSALRVARSEKALATVRKCAGSRTPA